MSSWLRHLNTPELEIEFKVRGLNSSHIGAEKALADRACGEFLGNFKEPEQSHEQFAPEVEVAVCKRVSEELSRKLDDMNVRTDLTEVEVLMAKIKHYSCRSRRFCNSFGSIQGIATVIRKFDLIKRRADNLCEMMRMDNEKNKRKTSSTGGGLPDLPAATAVVSNVCVANASIVNSPHTPVRSNIGSAYTSTTVVSSIQTPQVSAAVFQSSNFSQVPSTSSEFPLSNFNYNSTTLPGAFEQQNAYVNSCGMNFSTDFPQVNSALSCSLPHYNPSDKASCVARHKPGQVPKWNISFDGCNDKLDIHDFIRRLETTARNDLYPVRDLIRVIQHFVKGVAEKWLWTYLRSNPQPSWAQLRDALITRFTSHETERANRRFIEQKEQSPNESFNDYLLEMQTLNGHLATPFSDDELLSIIRERMNAHLQNVTLTTTFHSLEELRIVCQRYERLWSVSNYDPRQQVKVVPKKPGVNEIDFNFPYPSECVQVPQNLIDMSENVSALYNNANRIPNAGQFVICWNCSDMGHRYSECRQPLNGYFCRGCGAKCQNCLNRKTENYSANAFHPGAQRSQNLMPQTNQHPSENVQKGQIRILK